MKSLLLRRPIVIALTLGAIVLAGNGIASYAQPLSQKSSAKNTLTLNNHQALPSPNLTLPVRTVTPPAIYAKAYMVTDTETRYPLAEKNADTRFPIASTTKLMTAIVALNEYEPNTIITVSKQAAQISGSEINLMTNEKMTVENLLYALLVSSANDAAYALADAMDGGCQAFVAKMNQTATQLGLRNTRYADPAGLNDEGYSSPRDLATVATITLRYHLLKSIIGTAKRTITSADGRYKHELINTNRLIQPEESLYYSNAIGGKTGYTEGAGHCLVAAANGKDGKQYIAVVLNTNVSSKTASAQESRKLLTWAIQSQ